MISNEDEYLNTLTTISILKEDYEEQAQMVSMLKGELEEQMAKLENIKDKIEIEERRVDISQSCDKFKVWKFLRHFWTEFLKRSPQYEKWKLSRKNVDNVRKRGAKYFEGFTYDELDDILRYMKVNVVYYRISDLEIECKYNRRANANYAYDKMIVIALQEYMDKNTI